MSSEASPYPSPSAMQRLWGFLVGHSAYDLPRETRTRLAVLILIALAVGSWITYRIFAAWALLAPPPESPYWELALHARLIVFRAKAALGLSAGVILLAWIAYQALDRTAFGKRLWHWSPGMDSDATSAAKTLSAGLAFCALLLTFGLVAAQVLK